MAWCVAWGALAGCGSIEAASADAATGAVPDAGDDAGAPDLLLLRRGGPDGSDTAPDDDAGDAADVTEVTDAADAVDADDHEGGLLGDAIATMEDAGVDADATARLCTVKINEVQTGGATALDEFVELYHTCPDRPLDLTGWRLVYRSDTGVADVLRVAFAGQSIAAGHPYLVCGGADFSQPADARFTDGLRAEGGALALRDAAGQVVDAVGWGTAANAFVETAPAPAPQPGQSIKRIPDGHDTDNNAVDFTVQAAPTSPGSPN